ncbi:MAG: bifunctional 4-hydroxy-3-methylbut-2-enyl diphosphate reductase/30S ribosomal protein S1 [Clostridia bacterium]|nr:bifunctional 4-hydroxy-3-methylbut-2-enyl diphosphate reductase/30S ribosomal protein S1 [Clostridia bacterium]
MIIVAENAGFCFGVRRATDTLERLIEEKREGELLCTLGRLIHNEQYCEYLASKGILELDENGLEKILETAREGQRVTIVIRTHGVEKSIQERLENEAQNNSNLTIVDCTCPYVKKIHKIADENSCESEPFYLIGKEDHPEVRSIMSYVHGQGQCFLNGEELENYINRLENTDFSVILVAQTTQKLTEWKKCQKILKKGFKNTKIFDTICIVTEKRQAEAMELSRECDAMIVIGGKESSNTQKLYQVCKTNCENSFWIQSASDLDLDKFGNAKKIGITAGASTPDSIIQEVKNVMKGIMEESFAELFAKECEENATKAKVYRGATVTGIVMAISEKEIELDLGAKATGVITRDQITDSNDVKLADMFKIGDTVEASVIEVSDRDGIAILSKKKVDGLKSWKKMAEYCESKEVVSAKVTEATKGGLVAEIEGVRVFIPMSMIGVAKGADISGYVGTTQEVIVTEVKESPKKVVASMKLVADAKKKEAKEALWATLEEGMVFEGPVKSVVPFGVFVDIGGADGLVHRSELSWKKFKNPSDIVKVGDVLRVFIKALDKENDKISLGCRTDEDNPWNIFKGQYAVDDVCEVKVVGITSFGAFAEIVPGVDGLIHISQIADQKIENVADVIKVGDVVNAKIVAIDDEKNKVSLSVRALLPKAEPEAEEEAQVIDPVDADPAEDAE